LGGCLPSSVPAERANVGDSTSGKAVDTALAGSAADATATPEDDISIGSPTADVPVVAAAEVFPRQVPPGGQFTLAIRIRIAFGWHIFAVGEKSDSLVYLPTTLDLTLPEGIEPDGEWQLPPPKRASGPNRFGPIYENEVTLRRKIKVAANQSPASLTLPCAITFQTCNEQLCVRPAPIRLMPIVEVVAR
jgi:DsbC/DsbD-like thiol-disulfide interchange protein